MELVPGSHVGGLARHRDRCSAVAELFSLDLVLLMLAVGALRRHGRRPARAAVAVQVLAAVVASVAMLALVRPSVVKRLHSGPELKLGHDALVGKQGVVVERGHRARRPGRDRRRDLDRPAVRRDRGRSSRARRSTSSRSSGATAVVHQIPELDA